MNQMQMPSEPLEESTLNFHFNKREVSLSSSDSSGTTDRSHIQQRLEKMKATQKVLNGLKKIEHNKQRLKALAWDEFTKEHPNPSRKTLSSRLLINAMTMFNLNPFSLKQRSFVIPKFGKKKAAAEVKKGRRGRFVRQSNQRPMSVQGQVGAVSRQRKKQIRALFKSTA